MIVDTQGRPIQLGKPTTRRTRYYKAGRTDRLESGWTTTVLTADEAIRRNLTAIRARSREQAANNDYVRRFLFLARVNVVGPRGIALQAKVRNDDGTLDQAVNDAIERAWTRWGRPGNSDVRGQLSFLERQQQVIICTLRDGEYLELKARGVGPFGLQLQNLDADALDVRLQKKLADDAAIRMGIEADAVGRVRAYWLRQQSITADGYGFVEQARTRVPADQVIHLFQRESAEQTRGMPATATALSRLRKIEGYEEAALVAARSGAAKMGFYTSPDGERAPVDDREDETLMQDAEPGVFEELPEGVHFTPYDPSYPSNEFEPFLKRTLRGAASGLNVSYNSLGNDLEGVNFSSLRSGVQEDRDNWELLQEWMITNYLAPLYDEWLEAALFSGAIRVDGFPLSPKRIDRYREVTWQPRRWQWVDPLKDGQTATERLRQRTTSPSQIIRQLGEDPDDVFRQIAEDTAKLAALGISATEVGSDNGQNAGQDDTVD